MTVYSLLDRLGNFPATTFFLVLGMPNNALLQAGLLGHRVSLMPSFVYFFSHSQVYTAWSRLAGVIRYIVLINLEMAPISTFTVLMPSELPLHYNSLYLARVLGSHHDFQDRPHNQVALSCFELLLALRRGEIFVAHNGTELPAAFAQVVSADTPSGWEIARIVIGSGYSDQAERIKADLMATITATLVQR